MNQHRLPKGLHHWLRWIALWAAAYSLDASDPSPPTSYYELLNPRPGQLDPNHWKRLPWTGSISNVAELPNGRLLITGQISRSGYHGFTNIAVLDRFGWPDTNVLRFLSEPPLAIASQPGGSVAIVQAGGREMQFLDPQLEVDHRMVWPPSTPKGARLIATCLAADDDGRWLVGGFLETKIGQSTNRTPFLHRMFPDGGIESELAAEFVPWNTNSGAVRFVRPAPDGRLLVYLTSSLGRSLIRLLPGGLPDLSFSDSARLNGLVYDAAFAPDGRIYLAIDGYASIPTTRFRVVRINPDGSLDTTFKTDFISLAEAPSVVRSLLVDHAGRIVIAGYFRPREWPNWIGLARLFPDGSLDRSFFPGDSMTMTGFAEKILLDRQGRIVVAGNFAVTDRIERNDVDPPLVGTFGRNLSSSGLAILHNTDRPLAAPPRLANGIFAVESYLPASGYLILERAADMVHWQGFRTNFAAGTNWLRVTFPAEEDAAAQFYRVSVRP